MGEDNVSGQYEDTPMLIELLLGVEDCGTRVKLKISYFPTLVTSFDREDVVES